MTRSSRRARAASGVVLAVAFAGAAACVAPQEEAVTTSQASSPDVDATIDADLGGACAIATVLQAQGEQNCADETLLGVCSQNKPTLRESVASLMSDPLASVVIATGEDRQAMSADIETDFRDAMDRCIRGQAIRTEEAKQQVANDPELRARVEEGRRRFWHATIRAVARTLIRGSSTIYGARRVARLRTLILTGLCTAGARVVSDFMTDRAAGNPSDGGCDAIFRFDQQRWARCVGSVGSVCSAMGGFVDLSSWPGLKTEDDVANWLEDAASIGIETACRAGGPVSAVACGAINAAANQIAEALETGTNDWAECVGTAAVGVCIGTWWGQGGWSNNEGIEASRVERGADGQNWHVKACCHCQRVDWLRERGWVYDTDAEQSRQQWVGVIQQGDFDSGNCAWRGRQEFIDDLNPSYWDRWRHLHTYEGCQRIDVVGERCTLVDMSEGSERDHPLVLWDNEAKRPSGAVLHR